MKKFVLFSVLLTLFQTLILAITDEVDILAGPSVIWNRTTANDPLFSIHNWDLGGLNRIHVGFRLALRYKFLN